MEENFLNKQFVSESFQEVDSFFDNIPEYEEDFTFLQNQNSLETAHLLVPDASSSSNDYSKGWENDSTAQTISTESTEAENDINILQIMGKTLSTCAVIDIIDGEIKCCESIGKDLDKLGVCYSHFMFDQNKLHLGDTKKLKSTSESLIHSRRKYIQVPCIGQKNCKTLEEFDSIVTKAQSNYKARYVCCDCYEKEEGHLHVKPGKGKNESICHLEGKHDQHLINSLKIISKWIISTNNIQLQKKILNLITPALQILDFKNNEQINE
ncbi:hypothetical protein C1645_824469 [Glomus cerebriforme]|uniref:Uncharacterized protein n=1 Tax=Glomus cerebriforme TaxID=658196 RepID=A0A397SUG0_9GLOM|nr:hypothetical protein C1645_824469 [Glomus cerebriforme]